MELSLTFEDRARIIEGLQQKYSQVAASPEGKFKYPVGRAGLEGQHYDPEILKALPEDVLASYCGVGNPFFLGRIREGQSVLDVGCGAGVDTLVAAMMVGPEGRAVGIDLIHEMLDRARENLLKAALRNVSFEEASAEDLPFADATFDAVISNGVFNLVPDKLRALHEIMRVLKSGGRFMMADEVLTTEPPGDLKSILESWSR
jgi:arsenite methyltransferase